ncbi:hypothetical protein KY284_000359 [Solanum tuberosum]|nr:hypothetical protein KY284_000359 [Solanum tuberosum]
MEERATHKDIKIELRSLHPPQLLIYDRQIPAGSSICGAPWLIDEEAVVEMIFQRTDLSTFLF